jgi:hypothetical protein
VCGVRRHDLRHAPLATVGCKRSVADLVDAGHDSRRQGDLSRSGQAQRRAIRRPQATGSDPCRVASRRVTEVFKHLNLVIIERGCQECSGRREWNTVKLRRKQLARGVDFAQTP